MEFKNWLEAYKKATCESIKKQLEKLQKDDNKNNANNILNAAVDLSASAELEDTLNEMFVKIYIDGIEESTIDFDFSVDFETTDDVFHEAAEEYAQQRTAELVTQLDNSTKDMLRSDLEKYMKQGLTPQQISDNLAKDYAFSDARALNIARTETGFAWNEAGITLYETGGAPGVKVYDGDYDKDCEEANGQNWSFAYARAHKLQHPQCVRSFGPMPADEELDKTDDDI